MMIKKLQLSPVLSKYEQELRACAGIRGYVVVLGEAKDPDRSQARFFDTDAIVSALGPLWGRLPKGRQLAMACDAQLYDPETSILLVAVMRDVPAIYYLGELPLSFVF